MGSRGCRRRPGKCSGSVVMGMPFSQRALTHYPSRCATTLADASACVVSHDLRLTDDHTPPSMRAYLYRLRLPEYRQLLY